MGRKETLQELGQTLGLRLDEKAMLLHGYSHGFTLGLSFVESTNRMMLTVSACKDGAGLPDEATKQLAKSIKGIQTASVSGYRLMICCGGAPSMNGSLEKVREAVSEVTSYLSTNGYRDCCSECGTSEDLAIHIINGEGHTLCSTCFASYTASLEQHKNDLKQKKSSLIPGLVGALLGSLLGVAAIVIIGQLGYVAALSGLVMGVCTLKGYEMLGGKLTTLGIILSVVIMAIMVLVGNNMDWALFIAKELDIGIVEAYRIIPGLLKEGMLESSTYWGNVAMVYLFTVVGSYSSIAHALRTKDGNYTARRAA